MARRGEKKSYSNRTNGAPTRLGRIPLEAEADDAEPFDIRVWEDNIRTNYAYMDDWIAGPPGDTRAYAGPVIAPS